MNFDEEVVLVVLRFPEGSTDIKKVFDALMKLEDLLREAVEDADIGYVDGHEFLTHDGDDEITYFIYGPSADEIAETVKPLVTGLPYLPGSYIVKNYIDEEEVIEYLAYD